MGEGSGALLEVWGTPLGPFSESFEFKKKTELVQISIQMRIYNIGGRAGAFPPAPGESVLDKIKKEMSFIKKKGVITKKKPIAPKANLSSRYIDANTTTSRCLKIYGA
jgi:hypothetical protein